MHPINLLIFDLDGTLVDTLDDIAASLNHTLSALGRDTLPRDRVRQFVGDGVRALLTRALNGDETLLSDALTLYENHHRSNQAVHSALYPGVRETLEHFKGLPLAVVSNKTAEFIEPLLATFRIARYFRNVIGAGQGMPLKPAPDALLSLMTELGIPKERTVMVGDGTTDIQTGKAAGVITCAAAYGFRSESELRQWGPDYLIYDMRELKQLFVPDSG
jgi:phosphoglycolate phosphatase